MFVVFTFTSVIFLSWNYPVSFWKQSCSSHLSLPLWIQVSAFRQVFSRLKSPLLFSHTSYRIRSIPFDLPYCPSLNFMPCHTQLTEDVISLSAFFVGVVCLKCNLCQYHLLLYDSSLSNISSCFQMLLLRTRVRGYLRCRVEEKKICA